MNTKLNPDTAYDFAYDLSLTEYFKGIEGVVTALELMCSGLVKQNQRSNFRIGMQTFGSVGVSRAGGVRKKICVGCAATCTLQELMGKNFTTKNISKEYYRANYLNVDRTELADFESAIDCARLGSLENLFDFCGVPEIFNELSDQYEFNSIYEMWCLENHNWKEQLPVVRRFIKKLMTDYGLEWTKVA